MTEQITMEGTSIAAALRFIEQSLQDAYSISFGDRAERRTEARAMLRAAGLSDAAIYADCERRLSEQTWQRLRAIVQRRCDGEPLAYIEGRRGFHRIELAVDSTVLVPRPETELIVDYVLTQAPDTRFSVVDLGTGSGAIALAIASACGRARVCGIDISPLALRVAQHNARLLGLEVEWLQSDWFSALGARRFDFVCCNPPYVQSGDAHMQELQHEPRLALDGGADGLEQIRRVLHAAAPHLNSEGMLLLEHGYDQAADVERIARDTNLQVTDVRRDLGGHQRVSIMCGAP